MKHHDLLVRQNAEEHLADSFVRFQTQLKKPFPQSASVRHPKVRAESKHAFRKMEVTRLNAYREVQNRLCHLVTEIENRPFHVRDVNKSVNLLSREIEEQYMPPSVTTPPPPPLAVTDADASFEIKTVPAGKVRIVAWHEGLPGQFLTEGGAKGELIELKIGVTIKNFKLKAK